MMQGIYAILVLDLKRAWLDRARLAAGLAQHTLVVDDEAVDVPVTEHGEEA